MKQYDLEESIISCILQKNNLIDELFVDLKCFNNPKNKKMILFLKKVYQEYHKFDIALMITKFQSESTQSAFIDFYTYLYDVVISPSLFYEYQQQLIEQYRNREIEQEINKYSELKISLEQLIDRINTISNENIVLQNYSKKTPDEMIHMIRNREKNIIFDRFSRLNEKLNIKKRTVNVIAARPSEGKSALALNLFCDLAKTYKCIYFNMEMTEEEIYERMLGIKSNIPISDINNPQTNHQERLIREAANKIYNLNYQLINGSKTVHSIKTKIIKEQKDEHVIVFIDYTGYIVGKKNQNDRERIGDAVRELNNITKDYDCTIFLVAQINRNGSDIPTMQDLKDSGEIEQTADTILLIHDEHKEDNSDIKNIYLLIPKSRGGKRNIRLPIEFNKPKQRMEFKDEKV